MNTRKTVPIGSPMTEQELSDLFGGRTEVFGYKFARSNPNVPGNRTDFIRHEEGMWVRDGNSEKTFTDAKSIQNIVKHVHPRELLSWRFVDYPWTTDFSVNILYKNELTQSDLSVLRGDLPVELDKEWDAEVLWNDDDWN